MNKEIKKGSTLLVPGPSRVTLIEGKLEVFGKVILPIGEKKGDDSDKSNVIIIPGGNCYPLYASEKSEIELYTNNKDDVKEIKNNSIPDRWIEIKDTVLDEIKNNKTGKPLRVMVLGISSGKTTLIKYLANNLIVEKLNGGYLDSDLGQQIMYLPTTINIGELKAPIISSEEVETEETVFIGATFPKGNYKFILSHSCDTLIENYIKNHKKSDFILIDTDGWIKTEAGIIYKNFFIEIVNPDIIIVFQDETIEELETILENAKETRKDRMILLIEEENESMFEKDKDSRRFLRQSQFARVLEGYRKISIPLNDIKFIKRNYEEGKVIEQEINLNELITLPYHYVIMALLTEDSELIKIGLLFVIQPEKNYILLYSDLNYMEELRIKKILLGSLRLSTKGNHQGYLYL